jgi:hypothetical protein
VDTRLAESAKRLLFKGRGARKHKKAGEDARTKKKEKLRTDRRLQKGTYSPNCDHLAAGYHVVQDYNNKIRVRHFREETRAVRRPVVTVHAL